MKSFAEWIYEIFLPFIIIAALCNLSADGHIIAVKFGLWALSNCRPLSLFSRSVIFSAISWRKYTVIKRPGKSSGWAFCVISFCYLCLVRPTFTPVSGWTGQSAYVTILGYTARLLGASFLGYLIGEFANSFVLAKMKIFTKGRWCGPGLSVQLLSARLWIPASSSSAPMLARFSLPRGWFYGHGRQGNYRSGFYPAHLYHRQLFEEKPNLLHYDYQT